MIVYMYTIPESNIFAVKIDGLETILSFCLSAHFQGLWLLVLGGVTLSRILETTRLLWKTGKPSL